MAASDYRLCDGCGRKAFYDAQLNFHLHREAPEHELRYAGKGGTYMTLDYCGDWAVREPSGAALLELRADPERLTVEELREVAALVERMATRRRLRLVE